jgi:hypothetical protein
MNKFEKLIEYEVNDETNKAKELFHEIVVEKSRNIYESLMNEEDQGYDDKEDESLGARTGKESDKKQSDKARRDDSYGKFGKRDEEDRDVKEGFSEDSLGGDAAADLISDIEVEEQGITYEDEEEVTIDVEDDDEDEAELEDRVVDLEDKLDELMAEFEELMGAEDAVVDDEFETDVEVEVDGMDSVEIDDDEFETESYAFENVDLTPAPKPDLSEPAGTNTKSTVAANSGAKGSAAKPVNFDDGNKGAQGRPTPKSQDMGNTTKPDVKPAPKPELAQASGVNTKSVID